MPAVARFFTLVLFAVMTLYFTVRPTRAVWEFTRSHSWPTTTATVLRAHGPPNFSSASARNPPDCGVPFRYEVAGRSYVSERTGFDPPEFASCDVFRTRPYPAVGDTIRVIYDPGRPGEAVYLPAFPREAITSGLPFLAFTALFVAVTRRSLFTRS